MERLYESVRDVKVYESTLDRNRDDRTRRARNSRSFCADMRSVWICGSVVRRWRLWRSMRRRTALLWRCWLSDGSDGRQEAAD